MTRHELLNLMLSEGATHFIQAIDNDILFHRMSVIDNHIAYIWAFFSNDEGYKVPYSWEITSQDNSGMLPIKDFIP